MKTRLKYLTAFIILLGVEVLIALFVDDRIIRPYGGDVIVVWVVYCFVRVLVPQKFRLLPAAVFAFAVFVEFMQRINLVSLLHLEGSRFFSTVIGTSFSWGDIGCYALGCAVLAVHEIIHYKKTETKGTKAK